MGIQLEHKGAVATVPTGVLAALDEGVVEAIVSITNYVDNVGDLIEVGAYAESLLERIPKGLFSHDDKVWVSRTEQIEELSPGDPRLAAATAGGKPWPREAGALWVKTRFNLDTVAGREAFSNVKFFGRELEWSIGYRVANGDAKRGRDGVRRIKRLQLFEYSLVMFGAASQTRTLSVKSDTLEGKADRGEPGTGVMVALLLPPDVAASLAVPDGVPVDELHITLGYLGKNLDEDALIRAGDAVRSAIAGTGPLTGVLGGIGAFPEGEDGVPVYAPVDIPGLEVLRQRVVDALDAAGTPAASNHGFTPHSTLTYLRPGEALPPPVAVHQVAFDAVALVRGGAVLATLPLGDSDAGDGWDELLSEVKQEGLAVARAAGYPIPLSFEEIRDAIRDAAISWFGGWSEGGYVSIQATFSDAAIICLHSPDDSTTAAFYRVPWSLTPEGWVTTGDPVPVVVNRVGVPSYEPLVALMEETTAAAKNSGLELEVKAGRVLSALNIKQLRAALTSLISILKRAGIDVAEVDEPNLFAETEQLPAEPSTPPDSTAPAALPSEMRVKALPLTDDEQAAADEITAFLQACPA